MSEVTFIIPTISNPEGLKRCVDTIWKYHEPDTFRIFVIDNSPEHFASNVLEKGKVHLIIESYRNLGFGKSINIGSRLSETPLICICNDDIELVHSDYWKNIKEVFSRPTSNKILGVAPSSIKGFPRSPEMDLLPYKEEYTQADWDYLMSKDNRMPETLGWGKKDFNPNWLFDGTMFYFVVFKKEVFDIVGPMDEGYWPGGAGDDYDYCRRIGLADHHRIVQTCNSFVYHHWRVTTGNIKVTAEDIKKYRRWEIFDEKWNYPGEKTADIYGNHGRKEEVPTVLIPI